MSIRVAAMREGDMVPMDVAGRLVLVCMVDGRFYAVDGLCPHAGQSLATGRLQGFELHCPLHRARFDVRDGRVLSGPSQSKLTCYLVYADAGRLQVDRARSW